MNTKKDVFIRFSTELRIEFYGIIKKARREKDIDTLIYLWDFFKEHSVVCDLKIQEIIKDKYHLTDNKSPAKHFRKVMKKDYEACESGKQQDDWCIG